MRPKQPTRASEILLPWERIHTLGPEAIRDGELLAILLRTNGYGLSGVEQAEKLLYEHPLGQLASMGSEELARLEGITRTKSGILLACFELGKRALKEGLGLMPQITRPVDAVPLLAYLKDLKQEHFVALYLNARNQLVSTQTVAIGTLNSSLVHPREVFAPAVGTRAASVILGHNHPSGDVNPSPQDIDLTRRLAEAGNLLGIEVLDHLILSADRFLSMRESGLL